MNERQQLIEQIRQQSIEKRAQALREAARNQANNVPIAAPGASSSGGRRPVEPGCLPPGGLMLTLTGEEILRLRLFLAEDGVENGRPTYVTQAFFDEGGEEGPSRFILRVSWSGTLWELRTFFFEGDTLDFENLLATSPELYASEWFLEGDVLPASSAPGEEFLCAWRYCATVTEEGFTAIQPLLPAWPEIPLTEFPNLFLFLTEGSPIIWSPEEQGWVTGGKEGFILLGGTREALPLGSFPIEFGATLTISAGVCSIQPPQL